MNNNFKLRSTCPTTNDKNYISYKNGGFNHCIKPGDYGAKSYFTGSVLANCVGYACGRFNEIYNELTGYANGHKFPKLNCNAEGFIERAKETYGLEVSDIPVIGGIMVWQKGATLSGSDGAGHVAIVEDVIDNNTIKTSESDYDYSIYANKTWTNTNGRWGLGSSFKYRGCIINPAVGAVCIKNTTRNEAKKQVQVSDTLTKLRVRTKPSLNGAFVGWCSTGILDYIEVVEADGYTWYKLADHKYIAGVEGVTALEFKAFEVPAPVQRDNDKRQVQISLTNLRIRKEPSTSAQVMGTCAEGIYNILDEKYADSYTWYNIGTDAWVAKVDGVQELTEVLDKDLISLKYDKVNYEYRWSVDGNKYGSSDDVIVFKYHGDEKLLNEGWEEVLAVNGGLFYTWDGQHYANGLEKSRGTNNQDVNMSAVTDYNNAMAIGCTYNGELVFAKQSYIVSNLKDYYGAVTGIGVLLGGKKCTYGHSEFSSQYKTMSGRTILGEDKDGNYMSYSFAGTTGKTGLTGDQIVAKCLELGFHNAIMLDGGGSVARRYLGETLINTSRKLKNTVHLYRKKKLVADILPDAVKPVEPEKPVINTPSPVEEELNKQIGELNSKLTEVTEENLTLRADLATKVTEIAKLNTLVMEYNDKLATAEETSASYKVQITTLQAKIDEVLEILK